MKVAIVEDEINGFEYLVSLLDQIDPDIEVVNHSDSVKSAVTYLNANPELDLILMDIQLADGISFDIFDYVEIQVPVIFTTAYDEYAIQAFKVNSIDYLLKPILKDQLQQAIVKFRNNFSSHQNIISADLLEQVKQNSATKSRCLVKRGNHFEYVDIQNIAYILSRDSITFLFTDQGKRYVYSKTVEQLISELPGNDFFQISRSVIISIQHLREIHPFHNQRVLLKLKNGLEKDNQLIVSRSRVSDFKKWVDQ